MKPIIPINIVLILEVLDPDFKLIRLFDRTARATTQVPKRCPDRALLQDGRTKHVEELIKKGIDLSKPPESIELKPDYIKNDFLIIAILERNLKIA